MIESTEISKNLKLMNPGQLDAWYGPYDSIAAACAAVPAVARPGKTVGIIGAGLIEERVWHPGNITDAGLVVKTGPKGDAGPTGGVNIPAWTATTYTSNYQVNHLGKDWVSNAATVAGDVPGTSSKWDDRLSAYVNPIKNFETPQASAIVNDISLNIDNTNFGASLVFVPTDTRITMEGYIKQFRAKLSNAETGRKVRFYILRETSANNFLVVYDSGDVVAELNGINTFTPVLGSVKCLANDVIGVKPVYISSANSLRFRDSGGAPIATGVSLSTAVVGNTYTGTAQTPSRKFSVDATVIPPDLIVGKYWANKPLGYIQPDDIGEIPAITLPIYLKDTAIHTDTAVTKWMNAKSSSAIVRTSGSLEKYAHVVGGGVVSGTGTFSKGNVVVNWRSASPGFAKAGLLSEVRIGPVVEAVVGAKIQAWIVRPVSLSSGTFSLVQSIGEIDADLLSRWHVFSGLAIPVKAGDMVAMRGIGVNLPFWAGSADQLGFSNVRVTLADLTINGLSEGLPASSVEAQNRMWVVEADVLNSSAIAVNNPNGQLRLDETSKIPNNIGRLPDMLWQGKKIIWVGTSIPAGMNPSYPKQVGDALDSFIVNEAVGASGIVWDGTRALSLSATQAELTAAFPGNAPQSYEVKLIGKAPDLVIFDHGHNDRQKSSGVGLGTINSTDKSTFYGAFNHVINALYADNPNVRIAFVTPPNRFTTSGADTAMMDTTRTAIIALADKYGAPVCDLMKLANFNEKNYSLQTTDGTHPTQAATNRIATILYNFIKGIA